MFKEADASLGLASLVHIKSNLDRIFGGSEWINWEIETISYELKLTMDELTRDKIHVLQVIESNPESLFTNALLFLHSVEVINNKVADFEHFPMPNSLEIAYALHEIKALRPDLESLKKPDSDITQIVTYVLRNEGYSVPVHPFEFIPASSLEKGQNPVDTEAKKKAIELYIKEMDAK